MADDAPEMAHKDLVREHYNAQVKPVLNSREALSQRAKSETYPLKIFHNDIKRQLLFRFAKGKHSLLDMCCGTGGDILKWKEAGLTYVRGVDISDREVAEASRRFAELQEKQKGKGGDWHADFQVEADLGELPYDGAGPYDVVTCMFALHYFFENENRLRMFLRNVSNNLAPGGYFIGTIPDAKRVLWHMGKAGRMNSPMLKLQKDWQGPGPFPSEEKPWPSAFGHRYYFAVTDTVTSASEKSAEGSMEFLAFQTPILRIAAHYGMGAVLDYNSPELDSLFEAESAGLPFKHFFPQLFPPNIDGSLVVASSIFTAFVFRKLMPGEELPPLVPPLPSQLPSHPQHTSETVPAELAPPLEQGFQHQGQGDHAQEGHQVGQDEEGAQGHQYWTDTAEMEEQPLEGGMPQRDGGTDKGESEGHQGGSKMAQGDGATDKGDSEGGEGAGWTPRKRLRAGYDDS